LVITMIVLMAFAAGSIPFGVVVARKRGVDIQEAGSGNIGATNVTRVLGARAGAIVLLLDAAKGALPVAAAVWLDGRGTIAAIAGAAAIGGHCFSPWLHGKGGKGVATALGVFLVLTPAYTAVALGVFVVIAGLTRIVAVGSLAAMCALSLLLARDVGGPCAVLAATTTLLLFYTHRGNLARLFT
jgi:glycerol-3-phosphate acyltransferase PlsY